ncbi:MAG TPA: 30S ribosomal protein S20 [Bacillota bacterium]|nr:30S ribosomal protein S20 [Bacillota bacterium]HOL08788.1 30S ribosomal protein S20 [Bacillota bacterium]HPO96878.1 30S ribosomal protein S20 [Bacillota bacterium]
MPNIKSAEKRVKISAANRAVNISRRTALKTALKKVQTSITSGDIAASQANLLSAIKKLDEAVSKGLIHKNQAARRKSRLTKKFNQLKAQNA